jgi:hypothetical protein
VSARVRSLAHRTPDRIKQLQRTHRLSPMASARGRAIEGSPSTSYTELCRVLPRETRAAILNQYSIVRTDTPRADRLAPLATEARTLNYRCTAIARAVLRGSEACHVREWSARRPKGTRKAERALQARPGSARATRPGQTWRESADTQDRRPSSGQRKATRSGDGPTAIPV